MTTTMSRTGPPPTTPANPFGVTTGAARPGVITPVPAARPAQPRPAPEPAHAAVAPGRAAPERGEARTYNSDRGVRDNAVTPRCQKSIGTNPKTAAASRRSPGARSASTPPKPIG